jgi:hypothetical protein
VPHLRIVRTQALTTAEQIDAIFSHPTLYRVAAAVPYRQPVGRPPLHPAWALLGYGVLARVFRSGARTEAELASPGVWPRILDCATLVAQTHPDLEIPPGNLNRPPNWAAWKNARNRYFANPELMPLLLTAFTEAAVEQAHAFGLLDTRGPGSLCHPHPSRVVYGDGTVIRPMYRPPAATRRTDPKTGEVTITYLDADCEPTAKPTRRFDPTRPTTTATPDRYTGRTTSASTPEAPNRTRGSSSPSTASLAPAWRPTPPPPASNASTPCSGAACRHSSTTARSAAPTSTGS